jgi:hypothetical protein
VLYGLRSRDTPDEMSERAVREQLRCLLDGLASFYPQDVSFSELFVGEPSLVTGDLEDMRSACPALFSARPHERVRTLEVWLAPLVQKRLQLYVLISMAFPPLLIGLVDNSLRNASSCASSSLSILGA